MSARDRIFQRMRAACSHTVPPPAPEARGQPRLAWSEFGQVLAAAGGTLHDPVPLDALRDRLTTLAGGTPAFADGAAALLGATPAAADPETLDQTPCLVATGRWAVARTGSVLVDDRDVPVRAHLLLPERILLLVPHAALVDDLPDLYARYDGLRRGRAYFTLISGPSKTADIEQILVLGAHGPRRLDVIPVIGMPVLYL